MAFSNGLSLATRFAHGYVNGGEEMLKSRLFCAGLVLSMLVCGSAFGQATKSASSVQPISGRWSVRTPDRTNGSYFPNGVEVQRCGPLQRFLEYSTTKDSVTSRRVGAINGFAIYEVIRVEGTKYGDISYKKILVERKRGEFCEIFSESNAERVLLGFEPSYIVNADSHRVLVSRDPVDGNCGCFSEGDWTFDNRGPIFLDVSSVIEKAEKKYVPYGLGAWHGNGFDIRTLTYSYGFTSNVRGQAGGTLRLTFALRDHKLVLVKHEFDD